jgi:hypothetical protein
MVLFGKLDSTGNKGVLRGTIDEWNTLKDASNCKDGRRGDFLVTIFNRLEKVLSSVVDSGDEISKTFRVGSPLNNDLV